MEDLDLPEIKRKKVQEKKAEDKKEFKDLFQSDSDTDDDGLQIKGKLTLPCSSFTHGVLLVEQNATMSWPLEGCVLLQTILVQSEREFKEVMSMGSSPLSLLLRQPLS